MRHIRGSIVVMVAGVLLVPVAASGAGFALYEHGARGVAMGGAFSAIADDPTANYYNPAGLAFQEGLKAAGGFYLIKPVSEFTGANPFPGSDYMAEQEDQLYYPPHLYLAGDFSDRVKWGVGVIAPFGLGTWWDDEWAGRFISKRVDLKVLSVNPNIAFRLSENMAFAVGFDYYTVDLDLTKSIGLVNPYTQQAAEVGQVHIYADKQDGWGYNLAYLWKVGGGFSVGAQYRSRVNVEAEGNGSFFQFETGYPDFDAIVASQIPFDVNPLVESEITFPAEMRLAFGWQGRDWKVGLDIVKIGWDSFQELPIVFPEYPVFTQIREEDYEDAMTYRLGTEYRTSETWAWQLGLLFDETPVPTKAVSPLLPDADRWGISIGTSYSAGPNLRFDVGFLHLIFDERSTEGQDLDNFNGTYENRAELLGFTMVYSF